ncbi:inovirus-type Gp2 protein [Caballeronia sp. LZ062]|uniref:inovirus-type Gp2 protein n=1 Tax=unclassified Caballeronia TaxID=2646786 RepID=UPI002857BE86|nr:MULTISPECIES: inovirus-type Gp2 protein [unclassified Caballeronia]MDR5855503.1 inovirus-type Gp2 protein [Caballeronia sp. LZ050]MDR5869971.1 inovirus-type Gp2 protein [Caballeronia sp. LZ062]
MNEILEDQEALEALSRLDERLNHERVVHDGELRTLVHASSRYLFYIDQFVREIEQGARLGFVEELTPYAKKKRIRTFPLAKKYYRKLNDWLGRYSERASYSTHIEAFYDACKELGLIGKNRFGFGEPGDTDIDNDIPYTSWFNELVMKIHERCSRREFKERERLRRVREKEQIRRLEEFEAELFSLRGRSRWLVLSLTMEYRAEYRRWITIDDVQKHRDKFFEKRRSKRHLMSCVKAYVWAMEEGEKTGFHLHVLLFCECVTRDDEGLAHQIGNYWNEEVTEGKGKFWNSNQEWLKSRYAKHGHGVGVGQIDRTNDGMREALRVNLRYVVKAEQFFQIRCDGNVRSFGMSGVPKRLKDGRPRKGGAVGVEKDCDGQFEGMQQEDDVVRQQAADATCHWRKSGVPLPFPIEATVSVD